MASTKCVFGFTEVFVILVMAVFYLDIPPPPQPLEVIEVFAGRARLTRLAKSMGIPSEAHDIDFDLEGAKYSKSAMDINSSAGLLLPAFHLGPVYGSMVHGCHYLRCVCLSDNARDPKHQQLRRALMNWDFEGYRHLGVKKWFVSFVLKSMEVTI